MLALADLVIPGCRLADVGCDHGYIPIYLCRTEKIPSAIAMDINRGPLERAGKHIAECGLSDRIETRLSDGLEQLRGDEADAVLIAGMGGCLMCRILTAHSGVPESVTELILQPQSDIDRVRRCIRDIGFSITDEDMVEEDGKFYPMIKAGRAAACGVSNTAAAERTCGPSERSCGPAEWLAGKNRYDETEESPEWAEICNAFGPVLLAKRHPVLKRWLEKELVTADRILKRLEEEPAVHEKRNLSERYQEILRKRRMIVSALSCYS